MSDTYACKHCPARFEGEGAKEALKAHVEGFHPAGAPVERLLTTPAAVAAVGKDYGPAVSDLATAVQSSESKIRELQERVKALEEDRRSSTDLDVLAEQVAPRLGAGVVPTPATPAEPAATEPAEIPYADLQARAKELDIPATGKREELQIAIADEERRLAEAALAARSGEGTQGGDSTPASEPGAKASGEAGTPPEK